VVSAIKNNCTSWPEAEAAVRDPERSGEGAVSVGLQGIEQFSSFSFANDDTEDSKNKCK
jgi:hypothetical protein